MKMVLAVSTVCCAMSLLLAGAPGTSRADVIYVANQNNNTIEEIPSGGNGSVFATTGFPEPEGLAFDGAGNL